MYASEFLWRTFFYTEDKQIVGSTRVYSAPLSGHNEFITTIRLLLS